MGSYRRCERESVMNKLVESGIRTRLPDGDSPM